MKKYQIPLSLFLISLIIRIVYGYFDEPVIGVDAAIYIKLAQRLAVGDLVAGLDSYWSPLIPILTAIPSIFTSDSLIPSQIVSYLTGSLATVVTYCLIKEFYGKREAIIAAILVIFYPHLLSSSVSFGTANVYLILIFGSIITFWLGLKKESKKYILGSGLLLGLSYLTRPEAFGYLIFFVAWIGLDKIFSRKKIFSRSFFVNVAVFLLGFSVVALPYIFYLKYMTGSWTISGKFTRHVVGDEMFADRKRLYETAANSGNYLVETVKIFFKLTFYNLNNIHKKIPHLFPPLLFILVGVALFRTKWNLFRFKNELFLISFLVVTILGYAVTVNEIYYLYIMLPILIGWVARGIVEMENWLRESLQNSALNKFFNSKFPIFAIILILLVNIYLFPINTFMRSADGAWEFSAYDQRSAGRWIKANAKPTPRVMSIDFRPAFYAEGDYIQLSAKSSDELLEEVETKRIDYLVIDERNIKFVPELIELLNNPQNSPQLEVVYQKVERANYKIVIYKVKAASIQ